MSLLLWLACSGGVSAPTPPPAPSLLLVTLDTTRADHIGAYGYAAGKTPVLDALAAQGVRFDRAYATVPLTTPSHASMLTGLYPTRHGVHNNGDAVLRDEVLTLAERVAENGYRTAGSVSAFVTTQVWNLDQGFGHYFDSVQGGDGGRWTYERPADKVVDDLVGWLPQQEGPFFAWAHFYDAHLPYETHEEFSRLHPYDAEIAYADQQLGRLVEAARAQAGAGGLAILVVADHGEAFGEHGEMGHGVFVYDSTMRVPFVIVPPVPLTTGVVVDQAVSTVDVMPTALGLVGLAPPEGLDGRDLSVALAGALPARGPVYMESEVPTHRFGYHPEVALAEAGMKLLDTPSPRLYDVAMDPAESTDLYGQQPELQARLHAFREQVWLEKVQSDGGSMDPMVMQQLAALGYVAGEASEQVSDLDAKDHMDTIHELEAARRSQQEGDVAGAMVIYLRVLEREPQLREALQGLARAQSAQGDLAAAEQTYLRALATRPESTVLRADLAGCFAAQGRYEEGFALMQEVLAQVPGDDLAQAGMLKMSIDMGKIEEAVEMGQGWLLEDPEDLTVQAFVGIALVRLGREQEAIPLLQASLSDGMPREFVRLSLGNMAVARGDLEEAVAQFQGELGWFPSSTKARLRLADVYMLSSSWAEAEAAYLLALERPPAPLARLGLAQARFNQGNYEGAREALSPMVPGTKSPAVLLLHANLLAKEGRKAEGQRAFERAQTLMLAQKSP